MGVARYDQVRKNTRYQVVKKTVSRDQTAVLFRFFGIICCFLFLFVSQCVVILRCLSFRFRFLMHRYSWGVFRGRFVSQCMDIFGRFWDITIKTKCGA